MRTGVCKYYHEVRAAKLVIKIGGHLCKHLRLAAIRPAYFLISCYHTVITAYYNYTHTNMILLETIWLVVPNSYIMITYFETVVKSFFKLKTKAASDQNRKPQCYKNSVIGYQAKRAASFAATAMSPKA